MSHTNTNQEPGNTVSLYEGAERQYDQNYALSVSKSYGGSSGRSSGSSEETANPYEGANVEAMIRGAKSRSDAEYLIEDLTKYGYDAEALWAIFEDIYLKGVSNVVEATTPHLRNQFSQIAHK